MPNTMCWNWSSVLLRQLLVAKCVQEIQDCQQQVKITTEGLAQWLRSRDGWSISWSLMREEEGRSYRLGKERAIWARQPRGKPVNRRDRTFQVIPHSAAELLQTWAQYSFRLKQMPHINYYSCSLNYRLRSESLLHMQQFKCSGIQLRSLCQ